MATSSFRSSRWDPILIIAQVKIDKMKCKYMLNMKSFSLDYIFAVCIIHHPEHPTLCCNHPHRHRINTRPYFCRLRDQSRHRLWLDNPDSLDG